MLERYRVLDVLPKGGLLGRRKIFTNQREINRNNVAKVLSDAWTIHMRNQREINYLYRVYCGQQDVREKEKVVRPEINNVVTVNHANEIVTFKTAYLLEQPIRYASNSNKDSVSKQVALLNRYMETENKDTKDKQLIDWMYICGTGYRMVLPEKDYDEDSSPASIYVLNPEDAFVIYSGAIGERPLAGVVIQHDENDKEYLCVYTKSKYFEVQNNEVIKEETNNLGEIPIIEYPNGESRIGAFEVVLSQLNAINTLESNRVDSVQDFVNAFDVFQNCELDDETYKRLSEGGMALQIKTVSEGMEAKVYRITSELNQAGAQTMVDDMYNSVLTICGMPNRNGGSSTSDTGEATKFRDGWEAAESRANDTETAFKEPEKAFTKIFLKICNAVVSSQIDLGMKDIKIEFTRKNLSNIQSKVQVLCELLNQDRVHPRDAFEISRVFPDSSAAYINGMSWHEQMEKEMQEKMREDMRYNEESVPDGGQGNQNPRPESDPQV